jgi:hypothetical protein
MEIFDRSKLAVAAALTVFAVAIASVTYAQNPPQGADQAPMPKLGRTQICLRKDGGTEHAVCKVRGTGSARNDSCSCSKAGTRLVNVSICGTGMKPISEDGAFRTWRADTVAQSGTLVGTQYQGQPVCVRRR